jgi:hypothetical protein
VGSGSQCLLSRTQTTGGTNLRKVPLTETVQKRCNDQGDQGHEEFGIECTQ